MSLKLNDKEAALLEAQRLLAIVSDLIRAIITEDETYARNDVARLLSQRDELVTKLFVWRPAYTERLTEPG